MAHLSFKPGITRRRLLGVAGTGVASLAGAALTGGTARATPDDVQGEINKIVGGPAARVDNDKVKMKLPQIAENGRTVPVTVTVDSPQTDKDYVKRIHLLAEGNPVPVVAVFDLSPLSGKAEISARIRLAKTQNVVAAAEMNNGDVFIGKKSVKVTIGGCGG